MPTKTRPCNTDDIIDSRDVIEAIEDIETELEGEPGNLLTSDEADELRAELATLKDLSDGYAPDWEHGEALIRDSYFETYAQELADDIGAVDANARWPMSCIDWEQAARELQQDYTQVDFDGVAYWIR